VSERAADLTGTDESNLATRHGEKIPVPGV
jgi:hypothetical protein